MDNYIKNSVKLLPIIEKSENKVVLYTEFGGNYNIGDKLYIMVSNITSDDYFKLDSLYNATSLTTTLGYTLLKQDGNKLTLDINYDNLDKTTIDAENCYIGRIYINLGKIGRGVINSSTMRNVTISPNTRLDIIWKQGILLGSPNSVKNMDFNNKNDDSELVFKSVINDDIVNSYYTYNNNGIGLSIFNLSTDIMSIENCNINGGVYNNSALIGTSNIITKGVLNECTISGSYVNNGGELNNCTLLDPEIIWKNGKWKNDWEYNPETINPFICTLWENGDWVDGYFPISTKWLNGRFMNGTFDGFQWDNGTFNGGLFKTTIWNDGIFNGGMISGSTWNDGLFNEGIFNSNSTWNGGVFDGGSFSGSTWNDGVFDGGIASYITWNDGVFNNGSFEHSTWNNGIFNNGSFDKNSIWVTGDFYDGIFNKSTWHDGYFHKGSLFESDWIDGDLYFGVLNKVNWSGGTLHNGLINSIEFYDGEWLDGIFNYGTFHNGNWYNGSFNSGIFGTETTTPTWHGGMFYNGVFYGNWLDGTFYIGSDTSNSIDSKYKVGKKFIQYNKSVFTTTSIKKRTPKLKKF